MAEAQSFDLPKKLQKTLLLMQDYYAKTSNDAARTLLSNGRHVVAEGVDYDNWNGGTHGHRVKLYVPRAVLAQFVGELDTVKKELLERLSKLAVSDGEWWTSFDIEVEDEDKIGTEPAFSADQMARLWGPGELRVFISHKSENKELAGKLKSELELYGVSCFVAHDDIEPGSEWQAEIELALGSMNAMVTMTTPEFHRSVWTNQEIGFARARRAPIVPLIFGALPEGLVAGTQGLQAASREAADLARAVIECFRAKVDLNDLLAEALVGYVEKTMNYKVLQAAAAQLCEMAQAQKLTKPQVHRLRQRIGADPFSHWTWEAKVRAALVSGYGEPA